MGEEKGEEQRRKKGKEDRRREQDKIIIVSICKCRQVFREWAEGIGERRVG